MIQTEGARHATAVLNEVAKRVADTLGILPSQVFLDKPKDVVGGWAHLATQIDIADGTLGADMATISVSIAAEIPDDGRPLAEQRLEAVFALHAALTWTGRGDGTPIPGVKLVRLSSLSSSEPLENNPPGFFGLTADWQGQISVAKGGGCPCV